MYESKQTVVMLVGVVREMMKFPNQNRLFIDSQKWKC